ncbi:MAG: BCCT family transporter [Alphaproteobacteria bacterium]|nr:BCCT family transporter [Alphaproteobacteria bacterium]
MNISKDWIRTHIRFSHVLFLVLVLLGLTFPTQTSNGFSAVTRFFGYTFDWLIVLSCTVFLVLCLTLAFSRYGAIRLGSQDERPQFTTFSWLAMLFAAGMGTGLVFYGAAEPLYHMVAPPPTPDGTVHTGALAARKAMVITYVHWGLHAWAIYTLCALTIAYFTFRQQLPMLASSPIAALWPSEKLKPLMHAINLISVMAVVFGLVSSLAQGVLQMGNGLTLIGLGLENKHVGYMLILGALTACYIASALTGLGKGIKILSDINMVVCISLMLFVIVLGPTHFIMETFATSIGDYLSRFTSLALNLRHYSGNEEWTQDWTITYFLWWIAWGPFVGVFIARISRGRTIKEFIIGVLFVPTIFSCLWFSALGGAAIYLQMNGVVSLGEMTVEDLSTTTFALLEQLPLTSITHVVTLLLLFIFLVTSADSGSYVLGMFTSDGNTSPPTFQKLFWGIMVALVTAGVLLSGKDLNFVRAVAMVGAVPYLFIMMLQSYALWRFLKRDIKDLKQPFVHLPDKKSKPQSGE